MTQFAELKLDLWMIVYDMYICKYMIKYNKPFLPVKDNFSETKGNIDFGLLKFVRVTNLSM